MINLKPNKMFLCFSPSFTFHIMLVFEVICRPSKEVRDLILNGLSFSIVCAHSIISGVCDLLINSHTCELEQH